MRVPNWNYKLWELGQEINGQPFEWGITDCVTICRRAIEAQFGEDLIAPHISVTYTTKTGATRAFNKIGSMADIALAVGAQEIEPMNARDGDFLLFPKGTRKYENIATRIGSMWFIADPEINRVVATRLLHTSLDSDVRAFRF
jgi:hypothetical protein